MELNKIFIVDHFCSLGALCHTSYVLKQNKLRSVAYPFDWIFSNTDMIIDCISDNFNKFLDKTYYYKESHHSKYGRIFIHKCPIIEENYNYYTRCVNRFNSLLTSIESKLFMMMFVNGEYNSHSESFIKLIEEFNDKLSIYTKNYILLVIIHFPYKNEISHTFKFKKNIHFLELHTNSKSDGVGFNPTENDYLNNIINNNYKLSIKST